MGHHPLKMLLNSCLMQLDVEIPNGALFGRQLQRFGNVPVMLLVPTQCRHYIVLRRLTIVITSPGESSLFAILRI